MSLIEEALRGPRPASRPSGVAPARPALVESPAPAAVLPSPSVAIERSPSGSTGRRAFTLAVTFLAGFLGWALWARMNPPQAMRAEAPSASVGVLAAKPAAPIIRKASAVSNPVISPPTLTLNGVVVGHGDPLAVINGHITRIGESVENAILVAVDSNSARLRWRDQEFTLQTGS